MNTNTELFDLIKSLTSSEKRYFKLNASVQRGNKKYLRLFDLMDSQKNYDENALRSVKGNEEINKNFNFTKNYLSKLIFKSILNYKNEKSTDAKLFNILQRCRILFDKALFKQYFKTVKSGKHLAEKNERFSFLLEFIEIERQLTKKEELSGLNIESLFEAELKILEKIRVINNYKKTISKLFRFYRTKGLIRSENDEQELNKIMMDIESGYNNSDISVTAMERLLFAQSIFEEVKGNYTDAYILSKKRFKLILKNVNVFDESLFDNYKDSILSTVYSAGISKKFKEADKYLTELKNNSSKSKVSDINILISELRLDLIKILNNKVIDNKNDILKRAEQFLKVYKNKITINTYNLIVYQLSAINFFEKNYIESLRIFSEFSFEKNSGLSPFLEPYARMLLILIHFELKNYKLLKYMIPSAKKYLKSRCALHKTENTVLNYVSKISRENKYTDKELLLKELTDEMKILKKDKYEKNAFEYFDYFRWVKN